MNKLFLCATLLLIAPFAMSSNKVSAETPIPVTLATPIKSGGITPKEIKLASTDFECLYSGVIRETLSEEKTFRIIDVDRKTCGNKSEKVSYSVLKIKSNEDYKAGTTLKLYHAAVMTPAGPLFSADVMSEIVKEAAEMAEHAKNKEATN